MSDAMLEDVTAGHSGEENVLNSGIKLEAELEDTGIPAACCHSPHKQSEEWRSHPMQIKQEELHIKDDISDLVAAEHEVINNTEFSSIHAKPFTEGVDLGSINNSEAGTSDCKTVPKADLVLPTEIHTGSEKSRCKLKTTNCDKTCEVSTDSSNDYRKKPKHDSSRKQFQCSLCEFTFTYKSHLKRHLPIHTGEKPFECGLCEFKFARKSHLETHLRIHTGEKPFMCNLCEFKFAQKSHLKTHLSIHTGEKPFECDLCEFKFAQKSYLKSHLLTHTGEKPFACNVCEFKSARKSLLKMHMSSHTGEKLFGCDLCKFKSTRKSQLNQHLRIHTGNKPFECNVCEFKSAFKANLKIHMGIHSGEKPFECYLCEFKFAQKSHLKRHMLHIHISHR